MNGDRSEDEGNLKGPSFMNDETFFHGAEMLDISIKSVNKQNSSVEKDYEK